MDLLSVSLGAFGTAVLLFIMGLMWRLNALKKHQHMLIEHAELQQQIILSEQRQADLHSAR